MIRSLSTTSFFTTKGKHIIVCMVAHKRDTKKRAVKGRLVGILNKSSQVGSTGTSRRVGEAQDGSNGHAIFPGTGKAKVIVPYL